MLDTRALDDIQQQTRTLRAVLTDALTMLIDLDRTVTELRIRQQGVNEMVAGRPGWRVVNGKAVYSAEWLNGGAA